MVKNSLKSIRISKMYRLFLIIIFISSIYPCAVCYGAPDHPVTQGMNNAVIFLLATITFVLSCIGGSIFMLMKRTKTVEIKRSSK